MIGSTTATTTAPRRALLAAAATLGGPRRAAAQAWPSRPIRLVVGFPPGGSNDIAARILAPKVGELLGGAAVVVENRTGANGTIGAESVARAQPDGATFLLGSASVVAISLHTYSNLPYDTLRDFAPVSMVGMTPELVAVNPSLPARTLPEVIALARTRDLHFSSSGNGGLPHLAIELLRKVAGPRVIHVAYRGAVAAAVDTIGGQVQGIIMDLPAIHAMVREGKLRGIAVTHAERSPLLPETPTSVEQGVPSLIAVNWFAVLAPARTPEPIAARMHEALNAAMAAPDVREQYARAGLEPLGSASPAACREHLAAEIERWGVIAREAGARAD
jgi:tripartite-type tricarboxylate transporter receptor subunit TctC